MTNDRSYLLRRAAQERSAAASATGEEAREAHAEMAKRYRGLLRATRSEAAQEPAASV